MMALICSSAWATSYYIDPTCTYDGNGLSGDCAAGAGQEGAWNVVTTLYNGADAWAATGSDLYIKAGTTLKYTSPQRIRIRWDGTAEDHAVVTSYGVGAKPIIDASQVQTDSWTQYSGGTIYYATNTMASIIKLLTVDGVRYRLSDTCTISNASPAVVTRANNYFRDGDIVRFVTNGALPTGLDTNTNYYVVSRTTTTFRVSLTAGGEAINTSDDGSGTHWALKAGSFALDTANTKLYVWMTDGTSPSGNVVEFSNVAYTAGGVDTSTASRQYIDFIGLSVKKTHHNGIMLGSGTAVCDHCTVQDCDVTQTGSRGISLTGSYGLITGNDVSDQGSEETSNGDNGAIVGDGQQYGDSTGTEISYNYVHDTRDGSCFELNGGGGNGAGGGYRNAWLHDNIGIGCRAGVEIYGCVSSCAVDNGVEGFLVENNYFDNTGYLTLGTGQNQCIGFGNTAYSGTIRNNVCINFKTESGVGVIAARSGSSADRAGHSSEIYNNTVVNLVDAYTISNAGGIGNGNATDTSINGNIWKNNLIYVGAGGYCWTNGTIEDVYDGNLCYSASGNKYKFNGTNYTTLATYQAAYNSATGLTDNSLETDPLIDTTYTVGYPTASSPAIGTGIDLDIATDKRGKPRSNTPSIGAYEFTQGIDIN
jgi:hypothetical protein